MTPATKPAERLLPVGLYATAAARYGIRVTDRTLMLSGRLTRVHVGRTAYYPWSEVVAAMPPWARKLRHDSDEELRMGHPDDVTRDRLEALAHKQLGLPFASVDDEVAALSVLPYKAAQRAFDDLCNYLYDGEFEAAETVLDLLTGRLR
jgi:hypothetical protein